MSHYENSFFFYILFLDTSMNIHFTRIAFIQNIKYTFCITLKVFTVTLDPINTFLLNKSINFYELLYAALYWHWQINTPED